MILPFETRINSKEDVVGQRASALADQFEAAVKEFESTINAVPDGKWNADCDGGWTVAQLAEHVAGQFPLEMEFIRAGAEGKSLPDYNWDQINERNDTRAAKNAGMNKTDVIKLLQTGAASAAAFIRGLDDSQLDNKGKLVLANGAEVTTQQLIEGGVLIDHVNGHMKSIQAVLA